MEKAQNSPNLGSYIDRAVELIKQEFQNYGDQEMTVEFSGISRTGCWAALRHAVNGQLNEEVVDKLYDFYSDDLSDMRSNMIDDCVGWVMRKLNLEFGDDEFYDEDEIESELLRRIENYEVGDEPQVNLEIEGESYVVLNFGNSGNPEKWAEAMLLLCRLAKLSHYPLLEFVAGNNGWHKEAIVNAMISRLTPADFIANVKLFSPPDIVVPDQEALAQGIPVFDYQKHIGVNNSDVIQFMELLRDHPENDLGIAFRIDWSQLEKINQAAMSKEPFHLSVNHPAVFSVDFVNGAGDYVTIHDEMQISIDALKAIDDIDDDRSYRYGIEKITDQFPNGSASCERGNPAPVDQHVYAEAGYQYQVVYHCWKGNYGALMDLWEERSKEKGMLPGLVQGEFIGPVTLLNYAALKHDPEESMEMCRFLTQQGASHNNLLTTAECFPVDLALMMRCQHFDNLGQDDLDEDVHQIITEFYEMGASKIAGDNFESMLSTSAMASVVAKIASLENQESPRKIGPGRRI